MPWIDRDLRFLKNVGFMLPFINLCSCSLAKNILRGANVGKVREGNVGPALRYCKNVPLSILPLGHNQV